MSEDKKLQTTNETDTTTISKNCLTCIYNTYIIMDTENESQNICSLKNKKITEIIINCPDWKRR